MPTLNQFFRQEGTTRIWIILDSKTLLVLVSCPPFIPGVTLHLTSSQFQPAVNWQIFQSCSIGFLFCFSNKIAYLNKNKSWFWSNIRVMFLCAQIFVFATEVSKTHFAQSEVIYDSLYMMQLWLFQEFKTNVLT